MKIRKVQTCLLTELKLRITRFKWTRSFECSVVDFVRIF